MVQHPQLEVPGDRLDDVLGLAGLEQIRDDRVKQVIEPEASQASGIETTKEMITSFKKSIDKIDTTPITEAPKNLRIPISLVLFSAAKTDKPNSPIQEMKMVSMALYNMICFHFASAS